LSERTIIDEGICRPNTTEPAMNLAILCVLKGKFSKSSFIMLSFIEESLGGENYLSIRLISRNIKHQRSSPKRIIMCVSI